jgi:hypothetical protein
MATTKKAQMSLVRARMQQLLALPLVRLLDHLRQPDPNKRAVDQYLRRWHAVSAGLKSQPPERETPPTQ